MSDQRGVRWAMALLALNIAGAAGFVVAENTSLREKEKSIVALPQRPFFLQAADDGLCLSGDVFKRCAIDTLWTIKPGDGVSMNNFTLHHLPVTDDDEVEGTCLVRKSCDSSSSSLRMDACTKCSGAWGLQSDDKGGYYLSAVGGKGGRTCLTRDNEAASMVDCAGAGSQALLRLQETTDDDLAIMTSPGVRLITAASDGDKKGVKRWLEAGADVNSVDWDSLTALIAASSAGQLEVVKLLLSKGAEVNARDKDNITSLMEAAIMNHISVVKLLVKDGADVDAQTTSGVTALWLAAGEGRLDVVQFLIGKKASVNSKRSDGITALMAASVAGHLDVIRVLVEAGASVDDHDGDGLTALMNAAEIGHEGVVKYLLDKGADPNKISDTGFTPLILGAAGGHLIVCETLIAGGAQVNAEHQEGVNALMYGAAGAHLGVVEYLLSKGADVNQLHAHGGSALLEACTSGDPALVSALLHAGADASVFDKDGVTALMSAAAGGHADVIKVLLDHADKGGLSAPIDAVNVGGGTALLFAAGAGHADVVSILVNRGGADPNKASEGSKAPIDTEKESTALEKGRTPLMATAIGGYENITKILLSAGANPRDAVDESGYTALAHASEGNHTGVATLLVEGGANPSDKYTDSEGVIHIVLLDAILWQNTEFAELLISKEADVDAQNDQGVTPLIQASHNGAINLVNKLLEAGAQPSLASADMITPLLISSVEGHIDIVSSLIAAGADLNSQDADGVTALMGAGLRLHSSVMRALLEAGADPLIKDIEGRTALDLVTRELTQVEALLDEFHKLGASLIDDVRVSEAKQSLADAIAVLSSAETERKNLLSVEPHDEL